MVGHISLINVHSAYASTPEFFSNQDRSNLLPMADAPNVYVRAMMPCCFHVLVLKLFAYFMEVDRCAEMRNADAKMEPFMADFGGRVPEHEAWNVIKRQSFLIF